GTTIRPGRRGVVRRLLLIVAAGLACAGVGWLVHGEFRLPSRMPVDEVVADLGATLAGSTVEQRPDAPVHLGGLEPSADSNVNGGWRWSIVAPPPSPVP